MKIHLLLIFLVFFSMVQCTQEPEKPENLLDEEVYIELLVELQLARSYGESRETDMKTVDSLKTKVLEKYEVTSKAFRDSHKYYQQFPKDQKNRIEKAIERLKMDQVSSTEDESTNPDS